MSKNQSLAPEINEELFEPAWPYDMDDSYMQLDLGAEEEEKLKKEGAFFVFKRPWFKQNYRHSAKKNLRLYRRPYFHVAEE